MATREDLNQDLSVGMTEVRRTLEHYNLGEWQEYLIVRRKGKPDSFIVLAKEADTGDFAERLTAFHKEQAIAETRDDLGIDCPGCSRPLTTSNAGGYRTFCQRCVAAFPPFPSDGKEHLIAEGCRYPNFYWD